MEVPLPVGSRRVLLSTKQPRELKPDGSEIDEEDVETGAVVMLVEKLVGGTEMADGDKEGLSDVVSEDVDEVVTTELLVGDADCVVLVVRDEDIIKIALEVKLVLVLVAKVVEEREVVEVHEGTGVLVDPMRPEETDDVVEDAVVAEELEEPELALLIEPAELVPKEIEDDVGVAVEDPEEVVIPVVVEVPLAIDEELAAWTTFAPQTLFLTAPPSELFR